MSDDKVVDIHGGPSVRGGVPNSTCVKVARELLLMAESGELQGIAVAFLDREGVSGFVTGGRVGGYGMIGALEMARHELVLVNRGEFDA